MHNPLVCQVDAHIDEMKRELAQSYIEREASLQDELHVLRAKNSTLVRKNRRIYSAYRSVAAQLEDLAPDGVPIHIQVPGVHDCNSLPHTRQRYPSTLGWAPPSAGGRAIERWNRAGEGSS